MPSLIALASVLLLLSIDGLVTALSCFHLKIHVVQVQFLDPRESCDAACYPLKESVGGWRFHDDCKAQDAYGDMWCGNDIEYCQDCGPSMTACVCQCSYDAYRMRKEPYPKCSADNIATRAAGGATGNDQYGWYEMINRQVHCDHQGHDELDQPSTPPTTWAKLPKPIVYNKDRDQSSNGTPPTRRTFVMGENQELKEIEWQG